MENFSGKFLEPFKPLFVEKRIKVSKKVRANKHNNKSFTMLNHLGNTKLIINKTMIAMQA
ncbi:hypothetical protein GCM10023315_01210 [Algibacter aquimarinus]|uniref:Transposase n=1 Tax=Algibacter aquimarinus TaxID=1136748 RepID=A0ABP9GZ03_9FLAO